MNLKKHLGGVSLMLLGFLFVSCGSNETESLGKGQTGLTTEGIKIENIKATDAEIMLKENPGMTVLDIRTPKEFKSGHISKAINIDYKAEHFQSKLEKLDRDQTYLMYCRSGRRSGLALDTFAKLGFKHIVHIDDGILGWKEKLVK